MSSLSAAEMLTNPCALPMRSIQTLAKRSILVVAPHPDDETLGCGGTIALLRLLGCQVYILVMSDGTMSHPRSRKYPAPKLKALREQETIAAVSILGIDRRSITFLQLKDGAIPMVDEAGFEAAVDRCQVHLSRLSPELMLLPWRADPHPDHRAAWQLIQSALTNLAIAPRLIEYPIWDWDVQQRGKMASPGKMASERQAGWRIEISAVLAEKRRAIAQYRSQVTNLIDDDPQGFQLTPDMLENFTRPWEVFFEDTRG
ncbi:PIG-L family deacetylase [Phormidium tenue FACHB-886]|nr:PIG-L family deacetylase [Phormidium tenue FACHB-886]